MQWVGLQMLVQFILATSITVNVCIVRGVELDDRSGVPSAKLATTTQRAENAVYNQKSYKLEDFFWTGSGDGSSEDDLQWNSMESSTVFSTRTVFSTVYMTPNTFVNQTEDPCAKDCDPPNDTDQSLNFADRQFWLLTVLKTAGKDPDLDDLERSLTNLYKKAFLRQQAKHLGIESKTKRETKLEKPINVFVHKVDKNNDKIEVIYHVSVSGQPVDATTASDDMRLVTDEEVKQELGFPFLVKAEPYIKPSSPQELAKERPIWIYVGISVIVVLLLLLGVIILATMVTKHRSPLREQNVAQAFAASEFGGGNETEDSCRKYKSGRRNQNPSPTYINFRSQPSNDTLHSDNNSNRTGSVTSSASSGSSTIDISPLMKIEKQRNATKKHVRPKAAINKTVPMLPKQSLDTDSNGSQSQDTIYINNYDPGVVSPKSYLSMPSIKSFPRGNNPEPLSKVLEPVSVLHLDMTDDLPFEPDESNYGMFARHTSVGTSEDPGVIGPVVWNMHCDRLKAGIDNNDESGDVPSNVTKMRKRFHDLLDDTFSLFGTRRDGTNHLSKSNEIESQQEFTKHIDVPPMKVRPKTSDVKRPPANYGGQLKGAWTSSAPSPLVRPISAPYMRPNTAPNVDLEHILAKGSLSHNDPAIPLIAAIKKEIGRSALPGSTSNLNE
ncbi:PREDICTED: uncharacterized protein LOC108559681 isoform X2 [Nicrophorus vespilloides]|uniref:Uncharacterized protein LOC108559681 isoform X2 n=1 Tax=Nicrophorus vespilloides TaxID=110193 RepID=A0ABM1MD64_NICVS|nr:PREDICTED: uncharacterized protein LOC108559681 isoform X2 [Nicrophorus vespilloides]